LRVGTLVVCLILTTLFASPAACTEQVEQTGGVPQLSLLVEPSVRAAGMGGCSAVLADDPAAALQHPASLAFARSRFAISGTYVALVPGWDDRYHSQR